MQDRIKEHHWDTRLTRTETSAISEHAHNTGHKPLWNQVNFAVETLRSTSHVTTSFINNNWQLREQLKNN